MMVSMVWTVYHRGCRCKPTWLLGTAVSRAEQQKERTQGCKPAEVEVRWQEAWQGNKLWERLMAGPKTNRYLAAKDYETFYKLAHHLSEEVLLGLIGINSRAQILNKLYQMSLLETCGDPTAAKAANDSALQLGRFTREVMRETRCFFWPERADEETAHQANQRRWSPYNVQAWDAFFADFVAFMKARLPTIMTFVGQLQVAENLSMAYVDRQGAERVWQISQYIPWESYRRLMMLLTETGFEATLRAP
jgi:hypothetical protein